ncbi:MAG: hypothetical protein KF859_02195 [Phycisphaeraceae bacterium]|nr:hypothetical protein [Phycisphaeraceae bacterium]
MSAQTLQDQPPPPPSHEEVSDERAETELLARVVKGEAPVTLSLRERFEVFVARLSTRNRFWHKVCSLIWLPYAFKSGIKMKRVDERTFSATLPFKRFNRNWYNAMAGAALLANSEIAAGAYVFGASGGAYTIVCKHLSYNFLRPCYGPAIYRIVPREDINQLLATGKEFNITLDMQIIQQALVPEALARLKKKDPLMARICAKDRKVGQCVATFHVTPVLHQKAKRGDTRRVG